MADYDRETWYARCAAGLWYLTRQRFYSGVSKNWQFGPYASHEEANALLTDILASRDLVADEPVFAPRGEGDP